MTVERCWGKGFIPSFILRAVGRELESLLHPAALRSAIHLVSASTQSTGRSFLHSDSVSDSLSPMGAEAIA